MRFCGLEIADTVPDANTPWDLREAPIKADARDAPFAERCRAIDQAGFIPRLGGIVDAGLVAAPRKRNGDGEGAAIEGAYRSGRKSPRRWRRKTPTAAGRSSTARPRRASMARSRLISRSRSTATNPTWASTGCTARPSARSSGATRSPAARGGDPDGRHRPRRGASSRHWPERRRRVPLGQERAPAHDERHDQPRSPKDAARAPHAAAHVPRQRAQVGGALDGRACPCPAEIPHGPDHPDDRPVPGEGRKNPSRYRLRHDPPAMALEPETIRLTARAEKPAFSDR